MDSNRRRIPRFAGVIVLGVAGWLTACEQTPPPTPNVLVITLDTTRADYIGSYVDDATLSPRIDAVAAEGTRFEHAISTSQCTNPSHSSILTGLYVSRHQVMNNMTPLAEAALTLPEIFDGRGYRTLGAVSARHLSHGNSGFGQGFDVFLDCEPTQIPAGQRNELFVAALDTITTGPFFAWVHYFDAHGDYDPPAPYDTLHLVADEHDVVPSHWAMETRLAKQSDTVDPDEVIALYRGEITYMDSEVGKVLDLLETKGVLDDTIVVIVADHGESLTEKGIWFCHAGLYNQVTHVPLIIRWPEFVPSGHVVESMVSTSDVFPTILDLAGVEFGLDVSGRTLRPTFEDPRADVHEVVFSEAVNGVIRAVYDDEYKFVKPYPSDWALKRARLFGNLVIDPGENVDQIEVKADVAARLERRLDDWVAAAVERALPQVDEHNVDPETLESLRALGYIE